MAALTCLVTHGFVRTESLEYESLHAATGSSRSMTAPDNSRRAERANAANSLFAFLKTLPLGDRLAEGGVMAAQAVAGASLAFAIGRWLHTEQAFWAAITAIAVSQHSYIDTRNLSRDQFIGAMVGGICGLVGATLGGGNLAAYAATVAVAILTCWVVNVGSAARLGGITATIMLLVPGTGSPWDKALLRLGEVTLGTICALLVTLIMSSIEKRWFGRPGKT
ncbi:fusaric acid resistance family protein [Paraburkholderia fungorum]|nr:fusaric acid resistance family protein [Paraburkholderia fungorum]